MSGRFSNRRPPRRPRHIVETICWYKQRGTCFKCGHNYSNKHWLRCPAKKAECRKCCKTGHFSRVCWNGFARGSSCGDDSKRYGEKSKNLQLYKHKTVCPSEEMKNTTCSFSRDTQTIQEEISPVELIHVTKQEKQTQCSADVIQQRSLANHTCLSKVEVDCQTEPIQSLETQTKVEVASQTEPIQIITEQTMKDFESQVQSLYDVIAEWKEGYYEIERDLQEQEDINSHLEEEIAFLEDICGSVRNMTKQRKQKKHQTLVNCGAPLFKLVNN